MQSNFYAAGADLLPILEQVQRKHQITLVAAGLFASSSLARVELGALLTASDDGSGVAYLITPDTVAVQVRPVPQRSGGILYAIDELANPSSITLRLGGMVGTSVLLSGMVGTVSKDGPPVVLHRAFVTAIKKYFKRVQSYWVGPDAHALLAKGVRLTHSIKASREYDLVLTEGRDV